MTLSPVANLGESVATTKSARSCTGKRPHIPSPSSIIIDVKRSVRLEAEVLPALLSGRITSVTTQVCEDDPARDTPSLARRTLRWWAGRWPLALILVVTGFCYTVLAFALNAHLQTYGFDLGVYYEALKGYAHFGLPLVGLKGAHYDLLGDHFAPMLALLAPSYWIWPSPDVLLIDQTVLVAVSVVPVWMFTERRFGSAPGMPRLTTICLVICYALAWELQSLIGYDFHSLAFSVPILAVAIERADAGRWRAASVWILSLLLVKEDLALVVAAFGIYAFVAGRRRLGAALFVVGAASFGLLTDVVVPALAAGGVYPHWSYQELGPGPGPALRYVVTHPITTLRLMVTPRAKLGLLAWTFLPSGLLALLSPITVLAIPALLERVLSQRPDVWQTSFQYGAPLAPIVGLAVIDGLWRGDRWRAARRAGRRPQAAAIPAPAPGVVGPGPVRAPVRGGEAALIAMVMLTVAVVVTSHFPLTSVVADDLALLRPYQPMIALNEAERLVPPGVLIAASNNLVPHLLSRDDPIVMTADSVCGSWAFVEAKSQYPYVSVVQAVRQLQGMRRHGWRLVFDRSGILLLHKVGMVLGGPVCRRTDPLLAPQ